MVEEAAAYGIVAAAWDGSAMTDGMTDQKELASTRVTFGVTWGEQGFASESASKRAMSKAQRRTSFAKPMDGLHQSDWLRGKFVEIIFSRTTAAMAKSLKKMVGATGIEPVTPTMSR
jgi:hypothetical protein